jgi:hypothetical protein
VISNTGRSREQDSEMVMCDDVAGLGVAGHSTCPAQ